jgi:hypothetical protein
MFCLFGRRGEEALEARLLLLLGFRTEGLSIAEGEAGDGALGGLHLIFKPGLLLNVALNKELPVAMPLMVAKFVVDDLADKLAGQHWRRRLLGMDAQGTLNRQQKPRSQPQSTHPFALPSQASREV